MSEIQKEINEIFLKSFGKTPIMERLKDIQREHSELQQFPYRDLDNLQEEAGDLLTSLIQLCSECGWDYQELIDQTLRKINRRQQQYKSLGRKYNIVIYGGAFNPIHEGHIAIAKTILNTCNLFDEVWLTPCANHMNGKDLVPADLRLEMCWNAAKSDGRIKTFDYDIKHNPSGDAFHLVNLLQHDPEYYDKYTFYYAIGMDNALSISSWVNYDKLIHMIPFVVFNRPGWTAPQKEWFMEHPHIFLNVEKELVNISSTRIRNILKNTGLDNLKDDLCPKFLNESVYEVIRYHNLYTGEVKL